MPGGMVAVSAATPSLSAAHLFRCASAILAHPHGILPMSNRPCFAEDAPKALTRDRPSVQIQLHNPLSQAGAPPPGVPRPSVKGGHGRERCLPCDVLERLATVIK